MTTIDIAGFKLTSLLDKGIVFSIFIFAFASLTSKGLSSIGIGLACLLWLIQIIITKDYKFKSTSLEWPMLIFVFCLLASGLDFWSLKVLDDSEKILLSFLFYYVIINTIEDIELIKKLAYTALVSMVIAGFYGFYQNFYLNISRVKGFANSLGFGNLLAIFLMFTLTYILWGNISNSKRIGLLLMTITLGMNLLFTKSRGAWLGFIGGAITLAWLKDKRLIVGIIIFLLLFSLFLPQIFIERFKSSFDVEENRSNLGRIALWKGSVLMWLDHPINGVGIGNFSEEYLNNYKQANTTNAKHAHSNFFHFLATTGSIGFIGFSFLMFMVLKVLYKGYQQLKNNKWSLFVLATIGSVVVFNIQGLTEFNFGDTDTIRFFWFLVALNIVIFDQVIIEGKKKIAR